MNHEELIEKTDQLIGLINDSKLGFESKVNLNFDLEYSMTKTAENIVFKNFDGALDKLKGLRAKIDIGKEFRTLINEIITELKENWINPRYNPRNLDFDAIEYEDKHGSLFGYQKDESE